MKILVSTDGSDRSLTVLPHAGRLAKALGAQLVLCRVLDPRVDAADVVAPKLEDAVAQVESRWKSDLVDVLHQAGLDGEAVVPQRNWSKGIEDAIHETADEVGAVAIAMASRGGGAIRHALLGSVAMGVISRADLPIFVLSDKAEAPGASDSPYHILVTSDGSADSRSVFDGLKPLLLPGRVRLTLFEAAVMAAREPESEARARVLAELNTLATGLPQGVDVECLVDVLPADSNVAPVILKAAKERQVDAIASATHGHSAMRHAVAGSVALGVVKEAAVPVILVKSGAVSRK